MSLMRARRLTLRETETCLARSLLYRQSVVDRTVWLRGNNATQQLIVIDERRGF